MSQIPWHMIGMRIVRISLWAPQFVKCCKMLTHNRRFVLCLFCSRPPPPPVIFEEVFSTRKQKLLLPRNLLRRGSLSGETARNQWKQRGNGEIPARFLSPLPSPHSPSEIRKRLLQRREGPQYTPATSVLNGVNEN